MTASNTLIKRLLSWFDGVIEPLRLPRQRTIDSWFGFTFGASGDHLTDKERRESLRRAYTGNDHDVRK